MNRVHETGSLMNKTTRLRASPVRSVENIAAVAESVNDNLSTSTRHRAQELDISGTSLQPLILAKDLRLRPYKIQLVQQLKPHDHPKRFRFAQWAQKRLGEDDHFHQNFFSVYFFLRLRNFILINVIQIFKKSFYQSIACEVWYMVLKLRIF